MNDRNDIVRVLQQAKQVLIDNGWAQGCVARDRHGEECSFDSPRAVSFSMVGAMYYLCLVADTNLKILPISVKHAMFCLRTATLHKGSEGVHHFNDEPGRAKEECVKAYDYAIELAEQGYRAADPSNPTSYVLQTA